LLVHASDEKMNLGLWNDHLDNCVNVRNLFIA